MKLLCSSDAIGSKIKDIKMGALAVRDDLNIPRRKNSTRQRWFDCQVPKGVVECCVCGGSVSEFFNQIVCCSRCPVKASLPFQVYCTLSKLTRSKACLQSYGISLCLMAAC